MSELCGLREVSTATTHSFSPPFPVISMNPHLGVVVVFVFQLHMTSEMNNDFLQSFLQGHFHTGLLIEMKFVGSEMIFISTLQMSAHFSNEYHSQNIIISIKVLMTLTTVPIRLVFTSGSSSYLL